MNNNNGDNMHKIKINKNLLRTDLIEEIKVAKKDHLKNKSFPGGKVSSFEFANKRYSTIYFKDITDQDSFNIVLNVFISELKNFLEISKNDIFLVIGLGNEESTPDSLGPKSISHILVTKYLFDLGEVETGYSNVCSFTPNVTGNTGIETSKIIKCIIKESKATKVLIVDSLKANALSRLTKTIQISNNGISPGSGVFNNRCEISKNTMGIDVISIGIPTIVDLRSINNNIKDYWMVTPTDIDFLIDKLSLLIGEGINKVLHKKLNTTK